MPTAPSRGRRYRVADLYLRFWLHLLGPSAEEIERGRAVEPLIREALVRVLPDDRLPAAPAVGGYWTRTNDVEIDVVGADRAPVAKELFFVGSIKWLERSPFDRHDLAALQRHRAALTDEPLPAVAVSRSGVDSPGLDAVYGPGDLLTAWPL